MIRVEWLYWICAAFFAVVAVMRLQDREGKKHIGSAIFWFDVAFVFAFGGFVKPDPTKPANGTAALIEGIAVLALVVMAAMGLPQRGTERTTSDEQREVLSAKIRNWLFVPALAIPIVAAICAVTGMFNGKIAGHLIFEDKMSAVIGLGIGAIVALALAMWKFREKDIVVPFQEGDRLLNAIGWAAILPTLLATLGMLFKTAGVGDAVGRLTKLVLPDGNLLAAVAVYCLGMALFTIVMGNAFAAFPVMTAAVGWPVLIQVFHGNPAPVFAIGMLSGFCGTLVTPMAANFNLVPAALLELKDQYGPIKAQFATAIPVLLANIALMYAFGFPH